MIMILPYNSQDLLDFFHPSSMVCQSIYRHPIVRTLPLCLIRYRDCFANAFRIAWHNWSIDYVEGVIQTDHGLVRHAWNRIDRTYFFDATWEIMHADSPIYFPIIIISTRDLEAFADQYVFFNDPIY